MEYLFLKKRFEDDGFIYAAAKEKFKKVDLASCYDQYGNEVGHYGAGDYSVHNSASPAVADCLLALSSKFGVEYDDIDDTESDEHKMFIEDWERDNSNYEVVTAYNFWDGYKWASVIIKGDNFDDCCTHEIITDAELIKELQKALEGKEVSKKSWGIIYYEAGDYIIEESQYATAFEDYKIYNK